jgi:hypothetical protein
VTVSFIGCGILYVVNRGLFINVIMYIFSKGVNVYKYVYKNVKPFENDTHLKFIKKLNIKNLEMYEYEYNFEENHFNKIYRINLISEYDMNIKEHIKNTNSILNCSLYYKNEKGDDVVIFDLTDDIRYFSTYFKCEDIKMDIFVKYVYYVYSATISNLNKDENYKLLIIKNDDDFTEISKELNEIKNMSFYSVLS